MDIKLTDTKQLRNFLLNKMEDMAAGKLNGDQCKGITNLAQQVYNTLAIEARFAVVRKQHTNGKPIDPVKFDG